MSYRFVQCCTFPEMSAKRSFLPKGIWRDAWSTPEAEDMVAQLLVHGAEFWVHPAGASIGNPSPADLGGTAVPLMLIADDPDAVFAQAVAAGAVVRAPMQNHDYGWRDGSIMDPSGHCLH